MAITPDSRECFTSPMDRRFLGDRENDIILPRLLCPTQHLPVAAQEMFVEWRDDPVVADRKGQTLPPGSEDPHSDRSFATNFINVIGLKILLGLSFLHYKIKFPKPQAFMYSGFLPFSQNLYFLIIANASFLITHFFISPIINSSLKSGIDETATSAYSTSK